MTNNFIEQLDEDVDLLENTLDGQEHLRQCHRIVKRLKDDPNLKVVRVDCSNVTLEGEAARICYPQALRQAPCALEELMEE